MSKSSTTLSSRLIALLVVFVLLIPCTASATTNETVMPYASRYLSSYNTYVCDMGNGRMEIWFDVMGTGDMDEIGVLSIYLYESTDNSSWRWVKTFQHENYSSMLAYDDWSHISCVSYQGVPGRYYKAYVCIWAGKDGDGDTRYMWAKM